LWGKKKGMKKGRGQFEQSSIWRWRGKKKEKFGVTETRAASPGQFLVNVPVW